MVRYMGQEAKSDLHFGMAQMEWGLKNCRSASTDHFCHILVVCKMLGVMCFDFSHWCFNTAFEVDFNLERYHSSSWMKQFLWHHRSRHWQWVCFWVCHGLGVAFSIRCSFWCAWSTHTVSAYVMLVERLHIVRKKQKSSEGRNGGKEVDNKLNMPNSCDACIVDKCPQLDLIIIFFNWRTLR